jgi:hypothetical protein
LQSQEQYTQQGEGSDLLKFRKFLNNYRFHNIWFIKIEQQQNNKT